MPTLRRPIRRLAVTLASLALLTAAGPAAAADDLLQAGGINPCVAPDDGHLIEAFEVSGLRANKGLVQAAEGDRFVLVLAAAVFAVPPDPSAPPDPFLVSELGPTTFAIEPLRQDGLRAGSTVELARIDLTPPPDDSEEWKRLLDTGHTLVVEVTASLVLVDAAGASHVLDTALMETTIEPAAGG